MRLISLFVLVHFSGWSQSDSTKNVAFFKETITYLASDSLKGRDPATPEIGIALQYIRTQLKESGLKPFNQRFSYLHHNQDFQGVNCYAFIDNHKNRTVLIGAHYDHIGLGGELSKSFRSDCVHNGADDNASGVAMALALAKSEEIQKLDMNVLFVFYSAHEVGLFGSKSFADPFLRQKKRFQRVVTVVNFDMIGRMNRVNELFVAASTETKFPESYSLKLVQTDSTSLSQLDSAPYLSLGIPVYNFTTGNHSDYHKISDDAQYINYPGMQRTLEFLLEWLESIH